MRKSRYVIETAYARDLIFYKLLKSVGFFRAYLFEDFSKDYNENDLEGDDEELKYYERLKALEQLLRLELRDLREYVIGVGSTCHLYDLGKTSDNDWLGVHTVATWT